MITIGSTIFSSVIFKSLIAVLVTILLDFVLGVLVSIKDRTLQLSVLPQFIATNLFPYVGGLVVLALLSVYLAQLEYLYYAAAGLVALKFSKEALLDKIKELFT